MDAQLKAKWVEALRSGEFDQTTGDLHDRESGGYCCLGVLCKIMGAEFGPITEMGEDGEHNCHDYAPHIGDRVLGVDGELKASVCKEVGIPDQYDLIKKNDGRGENPDFPTYVRQHSFPDIADYIEANL